MNNSSQNIPNAPVNGKKLKNPTKQERLAQALRDNLRKRKAQNQNKDNNKSM